jgi:MerR family mercuric resistance operon transcriptional regulator
MKNKLTIGTLAKKSKVNVETIRYYQRIGLIDQPDKPVSGYRRYDASLIRTIEFIKLVQQLGFSLDEINEIFKLHNGSSIDIKTMAENKRDKVQAQIDSLRALVNELNKMIEYYDAANVSSECAIIDLLIKKLKN